MEPLIRVKKHVQDLQPWRKMKSARWMMFLLRSTRGNLLPLSGIPVLVNLHL